MRRLLGLALLLAGCGDAPPPPKPKPPLKKDPAATMEDADERAVQDLERTLGLMADHLQAFAVDAFVALLPEDFKGTPFGAPPPVPVEPDGSVPGVVTVGWTVRDAGRGDRRQFRDAMLEFLRPFDRIPYAVIKVPKFEREKSRAKGQLRIVMDALGGGRHWIAETFDAAFEERPEGWRIVTLDRVAGRRVRSTRAIFTDATEGAGLTLPPGPHREDVALGREPFAGFGGIAAGDVDGDGDHDLYMPRIGPDVLFLNEGGRFANRTLDAGLGGNRIGTGGLFFDADNDGDLDLLVTAYSPSTGALTYYENDGKGRFADRTDAVGLRTSGPAMTASATDVDGDGDLDVHVCMYRFIEETPYPGRILNARNGERNQLWINDGGRFTEQAKARGLDDPGWTWAAGFCDYDDDGDSDLYIANDFGNDRLYRNDGAGKFEDVTVAAGIGGAGFGMGVDWNDFDGDGDMDLYVSKMYSTAGNRILGRGLGPMSKAQHERALRAASGNTLYRNLGGGKFEEVKDAAGAKNALWAWHAQGLDYDNDGALDYYVANGYVTGPSRADL